MSASHLWGSPVLLPWAAHLDRGVLTCVLPRARQQVPHLQVSGEEVQDNLNKPQRRVRIFITLVKLVFPFQVPLFCKFFNAWKLAFFFKDIEKFNPFNVLLETSEWLCNESTPFSNLQKEFILSVVTLVSSLLKTQWEPQPPTLWQSPASVGIVSSGNSCHTDYWLTWYPQNTARCFFMFQKSTKPNSSTNYRTTALWLYTLLNFAHP